MAYGRSMVAGAGSAGVSPAGRRHACVPGSAPTPLARDLSYTRRSPPPAAGFVLVAMLWALAALALLASYVDSVVAAEVGRARLAREALQQELDLRATEATLLFLLATEQQNHRAVLLTAGSEPAAWRRAPAGELGVAGEAYAGVGSAAFAVQDEGGLVSVNLPREPAFAALLQRVGVPPPEAARVVARLRDYVDVDDALSLGGAERFDYQRRALPPPLNHHLPAPLGLRRVLGVDAALDASQWRALLPLLTARLPLGYNFNTMRPEAMAALLGVETPALERLLAARAELSIASLSDVAALTGVWPDLDPTLVAPVPSGSLRLGLWTAGAGSRTVVGITLTPGGQFAPWRKEYRYSEPMAERPAGLAAPATELFAPAAPRPPA